MAKRTWLVLAAWGILLLSGFVACQVFSSHQPNREQFLAGMTKQQLLSGFGEPSQKHTTIKNTEHIWGPIESLWYKVPMGTKIETWSYKAKGGLVELYFLDDSPVVSDTGFAAEGAVY